MRDGTLKQWTSSQLNAVRRLATTWFDQHGRELPWRLTHDPYRIWISEIMLQQTQVATVIPYYERFLQRFPTIESLASSSIDDVYFYWSGLGYYRRARQLHQAAIVMMNDWKGRFPESLDDVLSLPGIGRYTAGAIMSFACDQRCPIVEANTQRLYARLMHLTSPLAARDSQELLWSFAEQVLPKRGAGSGRLNQSLMEIGSQICTPKEPNCEQCPLRKHCPTYDHGSHAFIPAPKPAKTYTELTEAAVVVRDQQNRYLLRRCKPEERWAGLWDFPRFDTTTCKSSLAIKASIQKDFHSLYGVELSIGDSFHRIRHAVTRYRITLECFDGLIETSIATQSKKRTATYERMIWQDRDQVETLALSSSGKRLWKWLEQHEAE